MTPAIEIIGPIQDKGADIVPLPLTEQVREYIRASKAESTVRGYHADWKHFCAWCESHELCPLPVVLVNFCNLSVGHDLAFGAGMGFRARAAAERLALVSPVETVTLHLRVFAQLLSSARAADPYSGTAWLQSSSHVSLPRERVRVVGRRVHSERCGPPTSAA
jgi:hypothetical protein